MDYLAVGLAGFLGAVARVLVAKYIRLGYSGDFPVNTLTVNLTGSFFLCFFMLIALKRLRISPRLRLAVGTGFCGAYTTFSTFSLETINLLREGRVFIAFTYIVITAFGCVVFGLLGASIGRLFTRHEKRVEGIQSE